ncbi:protein NLP3-like isoform X1 [Typha angustifolia]|uniref:protein NLP3-like isoform X1 n=1 Tax=Typha angustifolia TaxID=59011 RepID=UPI003C2FD9BF
MANEKPQSDSEFDKALMEIDIGPFDPTVFFSSPSRLWIFDDDRPAEVSSALEAGCSRIFNVISTSVVVAGNSDATPGNVGRDSGFSKQVQIEAMEENSDASYLIKERMMQALRYFKDSTDQHVLAQVWAPVKNGDHYVLTTSEQPFVLDPHSNKLLQYRTVSLMYIFSVDEESGDLGLPGRVFKQRLPEWTPNVQYYSRKEYARLSHAFLYNVRGTLALPVFEPSDQSCVGVVELVMTAQKINYANEVDKVCKALEAVNLKSSDTLEHPTIQISDKGRQGVLAEILEILTVLCEAQSLPLAQTWVPCKHQSVWAQGGGLIKNCSSFDGNCFNRLCLSATDVAYVIDAHVWGFREACMEHQLQKSQGVAGRAFATRRPCFCKDVTMFSKTEYPLVHYARMFGLGGCVSICLQSNQTVDDYYILEFFLPSECKSIIEQQKLLDIISTLMRQRLRSLKVITDVEPPKGLAFDIIDLLANEDHGEEPEGNNDSENEANVFHDSEEKQLVHGARDEKKSDMLIDSNGTKESRSFTDNKDSKAPEKRRGKTEKSISLEVLQQYFAGSLKDAAKSLGVCPTTMKRICRQHGISKWPSRKISKVNRSLSKLKRVIESVQTAEGTLDLTSIVSPLPVAVGSPSFLLSLNGIEQNIHADKDKDLPYMAPKKDDRHDKLMSLQENIHSQSGLQLELGEGSQCLKSRSSSQSSLNTRTSQGLCHESPDNQIAFGNPSTLSNLKQTEEDTPAALELTLPLVSFSSSTINADTELPLAQMRYSCSGEGCQDERALMPSRPSNPVIMQELRTVTVKASYKEDIIRFRLPSTSGITALNDEVAKRLKLEFGTFDLKYLDDDHEWVMLSCDEDVEECIHVSRLCGAHVIRLAIHDNTVNFGSSCGSWQD